MPELILVTESDEPIGREEAERCHDGEGLLHRAFTILVFDGDGELLIQRRSEGKRLWPLAWETSCSGHPVAGEEMLPAAEKRLREELGISTELEVLGKFRYHARFGDEGSENEVCALLAGRYDGEPEPDPAEVAECRWVRPERLKSDIGEEPDIYAPWLLPGLRIFEESPDAEPG